MIIRKETKNLGNILVKPIDKQLAKEIIVKNHYSHKWNNGGFGHFNYGIFKEENPDVCLGGSGIWFNEESKGKNVYAPKL